MNSNGVRFGRGLLLALAFAVGAVQAQDSAAPASVAGVVFTGEGAAASLLSRALALQGLGAVNSLQTALFTLEAKFLDVDGPEATEIDRILYDIPSARAATLDNIGLPDEAQAVVTPTTAYFAAKGGTVLSVPRREVYKWHSPFDLGPAGLALARTPGATVQALGQDTWEVTEAQQLMGDVLRLRLHQHNVDYLLDGTGRVLALRSAQSADEDDEALLVIPTAWEKTGSVNWMVKGDVYYYGEQVATVQYRDIQLNEPVPESYPLRTFTLSGTSNDPTPLHSNVALEPQGVTAQDLLDESIFALARRYGGLAKIDPASWRANLQPRLTTLCAAQADCAPAKATPVIRDLLGKIDDPHLSFRPAVSVEKEKPGVAVYLGFEVMLTARGAVVREVIPDAPAARAGLRVGDIVTQINGSRVTPYSYDKQLPEDEKPVTFTLSRQGEPVNVRLTPTRDEPAPVQYTLRPDGIGVLRISDFRQDETGQKVHDALRKAITDRVKGLVLDLRWNPGGQLAEFMLSAGAFMQPSTLWLKQAYGRRDYTYTDGRLKVGNFDYASIDSPVRYTGPLAVLVNESSASGAEFLARELLSRPGTTILGSTTVGVGNTAVRRVMLSDGSELHVTMSVVQDAAGNVLTPTVVPSVASSLDVLRLVGSGQDSMIEDAVKVLRNLR